MTSNQIAYNQHLETQRHNRVSEIHEHQDVRSRRMSAQASVSQAETARMRQIEEARANAAKEQINWFDSYENQRHNIASERQQKYQTDTVSRDTRYKIDTERQLKEVDQQLKRVDQGIEQHKADSQRISSLASELSSRAQIMNASTNAQNLLEVIRHNQSVEAETRRSNMNNELINSLRSAETTRHNVSMELEAQNSRRTNTSLKNREIDTLETRNDIESRKAGIAEFNAQTQRGAAYAEGFKDIAFGVNQATDAAQHIYNIVKGVQSNVKQKQTIPWHSYYEENEGNG